MQKIAIVYFPNINTKEIDTFREKYDPGFKIISSHITIVSPVSEILENQFVEHIESVVKDVKLFSTHLIGLAKTLDKHLFLKVRDGNEQIVNLHDKLYSGILNPYIPTDFPFEPHITLGYFGMNIDDKLFDQACSEAEGLNFDITCNFDSLSIIKGDGLSPAKILKTIALQK